ncbi:MAG: hypothetical protein GF317_21015 [Candidatus Lokiarchaeota archaeon]|nr:hypothetical protein [Candidatus Lokiarchaeota archaeon]MBD3201926.1 hypothetical protein [Candidatus Lokiarchaeota archaeon]
MIRDKKSVTDGKNFRINLLSSKDLNNFIKNLSTPNFLGSIHLREKPNQKMSSVDNLMKGELETKLSKAVKNSFFNPITKILILSMIIFNIIWLSMTFIL